MFGALRVRGHLQVPGPGKTAETVEDACAFSPDGTRLVFCDGASESWDAAGWAKTLANTVLAEGPYRGAADDRARRLMAAIARARELHRETRGLRGPQTRPAGPEWVRTASAGTPDYATLVIVESRPGHVDVFALGDSIVLAAGSRSWLAAPDLRDYDFTDSPALVGSIPGTAGHDAEDPLELAAAWRSVSTRRLGKRPLVLAASDAFWPLFRSLLHELPDAPELYEALSEMVDEAFANRAFREGILPDDQTLVIMQ